MIFPPFRNLGQNRFAHLPHQGLKTLVELKAHNNPNLKDFPAAQVISVPRFFSGKKLPHVTVTCVCNS
jgi:hypothetical protein